MLKGLKDYFNKVLMFNAIGFLLIKDCGLKLKPSIGVGIIGVKATTYSISLRCGG